jgi:DNA-binding CsgD family transcriptional regulator
MSANDGVLTTFGGFLDEIREARTLTELGRAILSLASGFGYERCVIVDAAELRTDVRRAVLFASDTPKEKLSAQIYPGHEITRHAEQNGAPFTLDELRCALGIDPQIWRESLPHEARFGTSLVLPVHRNGRVVLKVGCNGPNADTSPLARSMLHAAAHVLYDSIIALNERGAVAMTVRETECLRLMNTGKSISLIAKALGIGPAAVRRHLNSAMKKLGVDTPLEALVTLASQHRPPRVS